MACDEGRPSGRRLRFFHPNDHRDLDMGVVMDLFEREILPLYEQHRQEYLARAREAAETLAKTLIIVNVDDVRAICPPPPEIDPRVMGAIFTRNKWQKVYAERSLRRECHGRPIAGFVLRSSYV